MPQERAGPHMMSKIERREHEKIQRLKLEIADTARLGDDREVSPFDARELTHIVKRQPFFRRDFCKLQDCYDAYSKLDFDRLHQDELCKIIRDLFAHIDLLFFFGLLLRRVPRGPNVGQHRPTLVPLVTLNVHDNSASGRSGSFNLERLAVEIWARTEKDVRHRRPLAHIFMSIVHEMCHAYLEIFANRESGNHERWVDHNGGHGDMFWELLRFIHTTLAECSAPFRPFENMRRYVHHAEDRKTKRDLERRRHTSAKV